MIYAVRVYAPANGRYSPYAHESSHRTEREAVRAACARESDGAFRVVYHRSKDRVCYRTGGTGGALRATGTPINIAADRAADRS